MFLILFSILIPLIIENSLVVKCVDPLAKLNSTVPNTSCFVLEDCTEKNLIDDNIVCADSKCRCGPDYKWNATDKSCQKYTCTNDQECQEYDTHRGCNQGRCWCNDRIFIVLQDTKICYPLKPDKCTIDNDCRQTHNNNTICFKGTCQCMINYQYNDKIKLCEEHECSIGPDCQKLDKERECSNKKCICKEGMIENKTSHLCEKKIFMKSLDPISITILNSTILNTRCIDLEDCTDQNFIDEHIVCADSKCRCGPDYKWNATNNKCQKYTCTNDQECQEYDRHRLCIKGKCSCNPLDVVIEETKMCFPNLKGKCEKDEDCKLSNNNNTACFGDTCDCLINYSYNHTTQLCEEIKCKEHLQCQKLDKERECNNNKCVCKHGKIENKITHLCSLDLE